MISPSSTAALDHAQERAREAGDAREVEFADALDGVCQTFDPLYPTGGEVVTPRTREAWRRVGAIADALRFGKDFP